MSQPVLKGSPAEGKERAVQLAVASAQPRAQTARDRGVHANPFHPWSGTYHRVERQEQAVHHDQLSEALQRLRKANARGKEDRDSFQKAAASLAHPLPDRTRGCHSRKPP
jgi:transposase-like protein